MIHQYKMEDLNIALDINSGAVHLLDEVSYDVLAQLVNEKTDDEIVEALANTYEVDKIQEALAELGELKAAGQLFSEDTYQTAVADFGNRQTVVKALCLHIAHDCNLKCLYCFAEEGEYHGGRAMMSFEVGKQAIDFLVKNSGSRRNLEIDFFGGEPLMNFQVVKDLVFYAKSIEKENGKNFRFTITTNGVLLDADKMAFINEHMYNVVLSVDGRKDVHDFMRPAPNGKGSYDVIMPKFMEIAESRHQKNYYVRGTFTHNNLDFSKDVLHLADLGFKQISVEPVVAPEDQPYSLKPEDLPVLEAEYELLAKEILNYKRAGKAFNFFHFMIDLNQGPCVAKRLTGCGSGFEYLAVTPWGDLYPCHQFVGMEQFKMGDVATGVTNLTQQTEFKGCNVYAKEDCATCWSKFYCGGGCSANAYNTHGNITTVYEMGCALEKKRVECAVFIKAKEMLENL